MITRKVLAIAAVAIAAFGSTAKSATLFEETFETYSDSAAFEAAWTIGGTNVTNPFTLSSSAGDGADGSNNYLVYPQTPSTIWADKNFVGDATHVLSDATPITFTYYVRAANWTGSRFAAGIRSSNATSVLLDLGVYNNVVTNAPGTPTAPFVNKWIGRFLGHTGFPASQSTDTARYWSVLSAPDRTTGVWHKLSFTASGSSITFRINDVDYPSDSITGLTPPATAITKVRIGRGATSVNPNDLDSITVTVPGANVNDWDMY